MLLKIHEDEQGVTSTLKEFSSAIRKTNMHRRGC